MKYKIHPIYYVSISLTWHFTSFILAELSPTTFGWHRILSRSSSVASRPEASKLAHRQQRLYQISWFWPCQSLWFTYEGLYPWSHYIMVSSPWNSPWRKNIRYGGWCLEFRLYFCWDGKYPLHTYKYNEM